MDYLLSEWLDWTPSTGRLGSIERAVADGELLIAEEAKKPIGFIHYVMHEDIIDGGLNSFITAFYVSPAFRGKGVGSLLLCHAIDDALSKGAVGIETSTIHRSAMKLYEKHYFSQTMGDIPEVFLELDITKYREAKELTKLNR